MLASSSKLRAAISPAASIAGCTGFIVLNLLSYVFTSATRLALALIAIIILLFTPNLVLLHESPVWLVDQGRIHEAIDILKEIHKTNNRSNRLFKYIEKLDERLTELHMQRLTRRNNSRFLNLSYLEKIQVLFTTREYLQPLLILSLISTSVFCLIYAVFVQA